MAEGAEDPLIEVRNLMTHTNGVPVLSGFLRDTAKDVYVLKARWDLSGSNCPPMSGNGKLGGKSIETEEPDNATLAPARVGAFLSSSASFRGGEVFPIFTFSNPGICEDCQPVQVPRHTTGASVCGAMPASFRGGDSSHSPVL